MKEMNSINATWYVVRVDTLDGSKRIGITEDPEGMERIAGPMSEKRANDVCHYVSRKYNIPEFDNGIDWEVYGK